MEVPQTKAMMVMMVMKAFAIAQSSDRNETEWGIERNGWRVRLTTTVEKGWAVMAGNMSKRGDECSKRKTG